MNLKELYSLCALTFYMMRAFASRLSTCKLGNWIFIIGTTDMVAELKTEEVGTSAVLGLDKASVSTRQLIIMDTRGAAKRILLFNLSLKTCYDLMACIFFL